MNEQNESENELQQAKLKRLEKELNCTLLNRSKNGVAGRWQHHSFYCPLPERSDR